MDRVAVAAIVVLSLVAVLSPLTVRVLDRADRTRAYADSAAIGRAILSFHLDTGTWPVNADVDPNSGELSLLVGLPADRIDLERLLEGDNPVARWDALARGSGVGALEDHLIHNRSSHLARIYTPSSVAPEHPGWNGPYLERIQLDPWGHPYVCDVRYLEGARIPGVPSDASLTHAVSCLSAGPNGVFDTVFEDDVPLVEPRGDDVGWPIQMVYLP
jgi:hypothetical protein